MNTVRLSEEGQIIIPEQLRRAQSWATGQELTLLATTDGILLRKKTPFPSTSIDEVAGCLNYQGEAKSLTDMQSAIKRGVEAQWIADL